MTNAPAASDAHFDGILSRANERVDMHQNDSIGSSVADRSLRIVTALSAEVAVLRERLEIVERLAEERGLFGPKDVDTYRPTPDVDAQFKAKRSAFIRRVFHAMHG